MGENRISMDAFITAYPNPLERDVYRAFDPPLVTYNDFSIAPKWPDSAVAAFRAGDPPGAKPYWGPESKWKILKPIAK